MQALERKDLRAQLWLHTTYVQFRILCSTVSNHAFHVYLGFEKRIFTLCVLLVIGSQETSWIAQRHQLHRATASSSQKGETSRFYFVSVLRFFWVGSPLWSFWSSPSAFCSASWASLISGFGASGCCGSWISTAGSSEWLEPWPSPVLAGRDGPPRINASCSASWVGITLPEDEGSCLGGMAIFLQGWRSKNRSSWRFWFCTCELLYWR